MLHPGFRVLEMRCSNCGRKNPEGIKLPRAMHQPAGPDLSQVFFRKPSGIQIPRRDLFMDAGGMNRSYSGG
jgi:hypothetical protein